MTEPRYHATIRPLPNGEPTRCEGHPTVIAAFLRAEANRLDPPRRADGELGPASGLRTAIRNLPDHRDRGRRGFGFQPVHAEGEQA